MKPTLRVNVVTANVNFPGYSYMHLVNEMLNSRGQFRRKWLGCFYLGRRRALGNKLKEDVKKDDHIQYTNWLDRAKMISDEFKKSAPDFILIQETNLQMLSDMGVNDKSHVYAPYVLDIGDKKLESKLERGTIVLCSDNWKKLDSFEMSHEIKKKGKTQIRKAACGVFFHDFLKARVLVVSVQLTGYNPWITNTEEYHFGDEELINYLEQIDRFAKERGCEIAIVGGDFNQDLKTGDSADGDEGNCGKKKRRSQILKDFGYDFDSSFASVPTVNSKRCLDYIAFKTFSVVSFEKHETEVIGNPNMSDHRFVSSLVEISNYNLEH